MGINEKLSLMNERASIITPTRSARIIVGTYDPNADCPVPNEYLSRRLERFLEFCDELQVFFKECKNTPIGELFFGKKREKRIDPYVIGGFLKLYNKEERQNVLDSIERWRRPYDQIVQGIKPNLEELLEAGEFFMNMCERAEGKLPPVKYLYSISELPSDFGLPRR